MTAGANIAARVHAGLIRAGQRTGSGQYTATLTRVPIVDEALDPVGPQNPWEVEPAGGDADAGTTAWPDPDTYTVTLIEDGTKTRYSRDDAGALIPRTVRMLTVSAVGEAPRMGDTITLADGAHEIAAVSPLRVGGSVLLFEVEIAI